MSSECLLSVTAALVETPAEDGPTLRRYQLTDTMCQEFTTLALSLQCLEGNTFTLKVGKIWEGGRLAGELWRVCDCY